MQSLKALKLNTNVYLLIVCVTFFVIKTHASVQGLAICQQDIANLQHHLTPTWLKAYDQTVFWSDVTTDGRIRLIKKHGLEWDSDKILSDGITPQGDPRTPFFFFGSELALNLGFDINEGPESSELLVPGAELIFQRIQKMNKYLKNNERDLITYLPAHSNSFLKEEDVLDFALDTQTDENILMSFPYADTDPRLAPHEISFHLGAILYPAKFFRRARQINLQTRNFAKYLLSRSNELGDLTSRQIARQLRLERALELDAGTANLQGSLGAFKYAYPNYPNIQFKLIWQLLSRNQRQRISTNIDYLSRPSMRPIDALFARLYLMADISKDKGIAHSTVESSGIGRKFDLSDHQKKSLQKIINDYYQIHRYDDGEPELDSPENWLEEFLLSLDERIRDITAAARATLD